MSEIIPYAKHSIDEDDLKSVIATLNSNYITQGTTSPLFEQDVAKYTGAKYAISFNSATSALHAACKTIGFNAGDTLWTTPITFVASANCALYCNGLVDFVDIDPNIYTMCPNKLEDKLKHASSNNQLPKVIVAVDFAGQSADMESIYFLAKKYGVWVIEDASHAIGATYLNQRVGKTSHSDITIFSFHPAKIITTGEGGMLLTNSLKIADAARLIRSHGITRDKSKMLDKKNPDWYYEQIDLGYNYRMTDFQAALGISQLKKIELFLSNRRKVAHIYNDELKNLPITLPYQSLKGQSSYHLYPILIEENGENISRDDLFNGLRMLGIHCNLHYIPVYRQPYYRQFNFQYKDYPNSEMYYKKTLSLPMYASLEKQQLERVIVGIKTILHS